MHLILPSLLQPTLVWKNASETALKIIGNYLQQSHQHQSLKKKFKINSLISKHYRHKFCFSSVNTTTADNNLHTSQLSYENDDFYEKLLESDNQQRFLNCIQSKKRNLQDIQSKSLPQPKLASVLIAICTNQDGYVTIINK